MNRFLNLLLPLVFTVATPLETPAAGPAAASEQVYSVRGVIREIAPDRRKALIRHEAITNYMSAMTMEFNVRDTNELEGVSVGDTITFRLTVTDDTHWIDAIRKIGLATNRPPVQPPPATQASTVELKPGDLLPDYALLGEEGNRVRFSDFRGKALAFTFFFTRCPLPDYCPRMANNFAKARQLLLATADAPTNWQFLSISFDPEFDQPAVLTNYANFYRAGNADRWLFAAAPVAVLADLAPRLNLIIHREADGNISHNLRTVVLDPQGRIYRQFDGNNWTAEQLAREVVRASAAAGDLTRQPE